MPLLECSEGELRLTKNLALHTSYAILSHTWGPNTEEATFRDLVDGTGKNKTGYEKIQVCAAQRRLPRLRTVTVRLATNGVLITYSLTLCNQMVAPTELRSAYMASLDQNRFVTRPSDAAELGQYLLRPPHSHRPRQWVFVL